MTPLRCRLIRLAVGTALAAVGLILVAADCGPLAPAVVACGIMAMCLS